MKLIYKIIMVVSTCLTAQVVLLNLAYAKDKGAMSFNATLTGGEEVPNPVDTDTMGRAMFKVNVARSMMRYDLRVKNGSAIFGAAGAHIHCAPMGANGPVVVFLAGSMPGGVSGDITVKGTLTDANIINPACGATISELASSMASGDTYVNVHSGANPSGVVRGQITGSQ